MSSTAGRIMWNLALTGERERDHSIVAFPLAVAGTLTKLPGEQASNIDAWIEDSDGDAIMCLHDCKGGFCFECFAHKCAQRLPQGPFLVSEREEQAIWQTITAYATPSNGFGEPLSMDLDKDEEVL